MLFLCRTYGENRKPIKNCIYIVILCYETCRIMMTEVGNNMTSRPPFLGGVPGDVSKC